MTADNKFAAHLRELSRAASAGPWDLAPCSHGGLILRRPPGDDAPIRDRHPQGHLQIVPESDAHAIVYLRNHADRLADLVERVEAARCNAARCTTADLGPVVLLLADDFNAMLAALDALVADAPGAASGTESPPRMNGDAP